jgi:hypothetical protein
MAFYIGTDKVIEDTDATAGISTSSNLDKLQINGTDVLTHDGSTVTLKNVDINDAIEGSINTDNLTEGSTNLFYATSLFNTDLASKSTSDLAEGTNLYYTDARADARIAAADTDDLTEGSTNLYYTDARVSALLGGGGGTTYATQTYVDTAEADANTYTDTAISNLVDTAPATLDTLNELAAALGDDPAFATTVTNNIATKIGNVVEDTTPQLGGNLDLQTYDITTSETEFDILTGSGLDQLAIGIGSITGTGWSGQGIGIASSTNAGSDILLLGDMDYTSGIYIGEFIGQIAIDYTTIKEGWFGLSTVTENSSNYVANTMFGADPQLILGNVGTANQVGLAVGTSSDARIHQLDSSGNTIFKLPAADGTANQVLKTDGAGDLSWVAQTSNTNTTYTAGNGLTLNTTEFEMSGSYTGSFTATGDITAYSDARLKRNVETISNPVDLVNCLRGVNFEKDGRHSTGVIAQEVEEFLPEVVHTDAEGMKSVAYGNISGLLIEAIKEQQKTIEHLQKQITDLQNKNS